MDFIVVIPARGGSKGIPKKNIKHIGGKPLIQYTIEAARDLFEDNKILVSTDDEEIKREVEALGLKVPFLRPAYLAKDTSGTYEVLLHSIDFLESRNIIVETLVLLQPTSPFRTSAQVKEAMELYERETNIDMVVSVTKSKSNPYYTLFEENENGFLELSKKGIFKRRQDCPDVWEYNGAIYIINVESLKNTNISNFKKVIKFEMDEISSIDLDSYLDWALAETIFKIREN